MAGPSSVGGCRNRKGAASQPTYKNDPGCDHTHCRYYKMHFTRLAIADCMGARCGSGRFTSADIYILQTVLVPENALTEME
jgi:hypothetical protein